MDAAAVGRRERWLTFDRSRRRPGGLRSRRRGRPAPVGDAAALAEAGHLHRGAGAAGVDRARRAYQGALSANPIAEIDNELGLTALILLVASLACTPRRRLFGWTWPVRIRRELGLFAFFYAMLHFLIYLVLDQGFDLAHHRRRTSPSGRLSRSGSWRWC